MPYKPTEADLDWGRQMLAGIPEDGFIAFPVRETPRLMYYVNHKTKVLTLANPEVLSARYCYFEWQMKTIEVFKALGYEVREMPNPTNDYQEQVVRTVAETVQFEDVTDLIDEDGRVRYRR
jgi:hypothetical protein